MATLSSETFHSPSPVLLGSVVPDRGRGGRVGSTIVGRPRTKSHLFGPCTILFQSPCLSGLPSNVFPFDSEICAQNFTYIIAHDDATSPGIIHFFGMMMIEYLLTHPHFSRRWNCDEERRRREEHDRMAQLKLM